MTTNYHLNDFIELDSEILEEHSNIADELLEVEHLDLDNTEYLAKLLFCLERYDESIEQFKRILPLKENDEKTMACIAVNYFKKRDFENAIEYLNECLERNPDRECLLSYKMLCHEFLNDYESAIACGKRILKNNPKNTSAIKRMIDYHLELEDFDKCLAYISQIKDYDPHKKALILYESGRYEECIEESGKIRSTESYRLAGKSYLKLGNVAKAVKHLFRSYEKEPNIDVLFEISEIYFEAEDYAKSIYFLKRVLIHDDSNVEALSKIALAYLNTSHWIDAIEYAEKTLEISKKVPEAYVTLAETHFQLDRGRLENALKVLDEGISENPESAKLWAKKGGYCYPHDLHAFQKSYEKAISLNPSNNKIYLEYIYLLMMNDSLEEAKKQYNQMLLYNPIFEKSFQELYDEWFSW